MNKFLVFGIAGHSAATPGYAYRVTLAGTVAAQGDYLDMGTDDAIGGDGTHHYYQKADNSARIWWSFVGETCMWTMGDLFDTKWYFAVDAITGEWTQNVGDLPVPTVTTP